VVDAEDKFELFRFQVVVPNLTFRGHTDVQNIVRSKNQRLCEFAKPTSCPQGNCIHILAVLIENKNLVDIGRVRMVSERSYPHVSVRSDDNAVRAVEMTRSRMVRQNGFETSYGIETGEISSQLAWSINANKGSDVEFAFEINDGAWLERIDLLDRGREFAKELSARVVVDTNVSLTDLRRFFSRKVAIVGNHEKIARNPNNTARTVRCLWL